MGKGKEMKIFSELDP